MARIIWSGTPLASRRSGGVVHYNTPYAPMDRQAPVPLRPTALNLAQPAAALSFLAYYWSALMTDAQRALWTAAAVAPLNGYTYFLQQAITPCTYGLPYVVIPTPNPDYTGDITMACYNDTTDGRSYLLCSWVNDDPPPPNTYMTFAFMRSYLFAFKVTATAPADYRDVRPQSGYVAFGAVGPLSNTYENKVDITDAITAFFGQIPLGYDGIVRNGYLTASATVAQISLVQGDGSMLTLGGKLVTKYSTQWALNLGMGLSARPRVASAFVPSRHTAARMLAMGLTVPNHPF